MNRFASHRRLATMTLVLAAALGANAAHGATTVYRCGPGGNVYSDLPCVDGRVLAINDERSEAQRADGLRVAAAERRLGDELQRERMQAAALKAPMNGSFKATSIAVAVPVVRVAALPKKRHRALNPWQQTGNDSHFVVIVPAVATTIAGASGKHAGR